MVPESKWIVDEDLSRTLDEVQTVLGHRYAQMGILLEALTHSSYSNEKAGGEKRNDALPDNERLEFLGDAVIGLVIGKKLMDLFPEATEGCLSRWRSQLVSRKMLAEMALELGMGRWVLLGRGERRTGGAEKRSIMAGVFEAVVGSLFLDAGLAKCEDFLLQIYERPITQIDEDTVSDRKRADQKTFLQEFTQGKYRSIPIYRLVDVWGLEHEKNFRVEIEIEGRIVAEGNGRSKKEAEQHAASRALEILGV